MKSNESGENSGLYLLKDLRKSPPVEAEVYDDPLEELLNEFSDFEDDEEGLKEATLDELEEFLASERDLPENRKAAILEQIEVLKEIYGRIKYYMDEVTSHFPG